MVFKVSRIDGLKVIYKAIGNKLKLTLLNLIMKILHVVYLKVQL